MTDDPFTPRLRPSECILWSGRPNQGLRLRRADWLLIPFSIMWGGFAIAWEAAALGIGFGILGAASGRSVGAVALLFPLWGVPFVLVGLFLLVGRFFADAWLRRGVQYALTDQRILIARTLGGRSLQSAELSDNIRLAGVRPDGRGTVAFGPDVGLSGIFGAGRSLSIWVPALSRTPEFRGIAEAERVFDLAQRQAGSRRLR